MTTNGARVTYKDIMDFQEKVFDELTGIRKDVADLRVQAGEDRGSVSALIRRDTIGYWVDVLSIALTFGVIAAVEYLRSK